MRAIITIPCPKGQARKTHRKFRVAIMKWRAPKKHYWNHDMDTLYWEVEAQPAIVQSVYRKVDMAVVASQVVMGNAMKLLRTDEDKKELMDYTVRTTEIKYID